MYTDEVLGCWWGGSEPTAKKDLWKTSLVGKKLILLKHRDRTNGQEDLHWGCDV